VKTARFYYKRLQNDGALNFVQLFSAPLCKCAWLPVTWDSCLMKPTHVWYFLFIGDCYICYASALILLSALSPLVTVCRLDRCCSTILIITRLFVIRLPQRQRARHHGNAGGLLITYRSHGHTAHWASPWFTETAHNACFTFDSV